MIFQSICIYLSSFIISIIGAYLYDRYNKYHKVIHVNMRIFYYFIILLFPFIVSGFRFGVGTDYFSYAEIDSYVRYLGFSNLFNTYLEPGYVLINKFSTIVFRTERGIFVVTSFIVLLIVIKILDYYKGKLSISFGLYIFYMTVFQASFNGIRNYISAFIILYGYRYVMERKLFKYIVVVLVASSIHKSAIICLLFYILVPNKKSIGKIRDIYFYGLLLASPLLISVIAQIIRIISMHFGIYTDYMNGVIDQKSLSFILYIFPVALIILIYKKKLIRFDAKYEFLVKLYFLQIPFQFLANYIPYGDRLALYCSVVQIILVPIITKLQKRENKIILTSVLIIWYAFYYFVVNIYMNGNGTYPYTWSLSL